MTPILILPIDLLPEGTEPADWRDALGPLVQVRYSATANEPALITFEQLMAMAEIASRPPTGPIRDGAIERIEITSTRTGQKRIVEERMQVFHAPPERTHGCQCGANYTTAALLKAHQHRCVTAQRMKDPAMVGDHKPGRYIDGSAGEP